MGRDLGIAVLRHGRALLPAVLLVAGLGSTGLAPAYADDPTAPPGTAQVSPPSLSPPSQQQIQDAKDALERMRNGGVPRPASPPVLAPVAGTTSAGRAGSVASRISDQAWWTIGAGALVLVVLSETTRLSVRRAKHRKGT